MLLIDIEGIKSLNDLFLQIIKQNLSSDALQWLETKVELIKTEEKSIQLNLTFSHLPRLAGKQPIVLQPEDEAKIAQLLPGFSLKEWTADRLSRVWLLMQVPNENKEAYIKKISGLFIGSEMNEQIALYSALPFLSYAEEWVSRCEDGIRSNIGTVLEAIMYHNPYPAHFLSEGAWNQLVLKAFFTDKNVNHIVGLNERSNQALTDTLSDYVQERLAAHRTVNPEIYKLIEQKNQTI
ncbi:EboA domain-containing protein [Pedobacter foliorum]|uniref:EboA domain-containing protein n=1 Tax=Pedobacter foliorum TaxID=2739058 RepID=UPI001564AC4F|nr:EboA domain-containing protein [Pedobacter foliorum]NRF38896.1 EboA domain-containing protein [Pedobacter foliorum]